MNKVVILPAVKVPAAHGDFKGQAQGPGPGSGGWGGFA